MSHVNKWKHSMLSPHLEISDPLRLMLGKITNTQCPHNIGKKDSAEGRYYWDAAHYGLSGTRAFNNLSLEKQSLVLEKLNTWSLDLAYSIEKFGLNYGAKMIYMAETTEEKSLYTVFSNDEVTHRLKIEPFLRGKNIPDRIDFHPLLPALALALEQGGRESLIFTVQVILEGFGLTHYSSLEKNCQNSDLKKHLAEIVADEVNHHGMGLAMTHRVKLDHIVRKELLELTHNFIQSLKNAEWVMRAIEEVDGQLTGTQVAQFRQETAWEVQIKTRLERVRTLIMKSGYKHLIEDLEQQGLF